MESDKANLAVPPPRRKFFGVLGGLGTTIAATWAGFRGGAGAETHAAPLPPILAESTGNLVVRMQRELEELLAGGGTPSWLMVVDTRKCVGCDACSVACRAENPTGPGGAFRRVVEISLIRALRPVSIFKPANCLQCDDPPCARAVPPGMVRKRPDGIVEFDQAALRGSYARAAAEACPFGAAHVDDGRTFTQDSPAPQAYEERVFLENGVEHRRRPGEGTLQDVARKCTFCSHLLDDGLLPACITTCPGGAMYFGDANNPGSLVMEVTRGRRLFFGHETLGVKPRVIYFEEPMPDASYVDCAVCHQPGGVR